MKRQRDFLTYLDDIYEFIIKGISFIEGMAYEEFKEDEKTQFALVRVFEIIGEASKKIPNGIKQQSKEIPWREISGMRDVLIHDYFGINTKMVWETAKNDLPELRNKIRKLLDDIK